MLSIHLNAHLEVPAAIPGLYYSSSYNSILLPIIVPRSIDIANNNFHCLLLREIR
ncbi:unnamed protein product, partial [Nesidiocoris tenuis]